MLRVQIQLPQRQVCRDPGLQIQRQGDQEDRLNLLYPVSHSMQFVPAQPLRAELCQPQVVGCVGL